MVVLESDNVKISWFFQTSSAALYVNVVTTPSEVIPLWHLWSTPCPRGEQIGVQAKCSNLGTGAASEAVIISLTAPYAGGLLWSPGLSSLKTNIAADREWHLPMTGGMSDFSAAVAATSGNSYCHHLTCSHLNMELTFNSENMVHQNSCKVLLTYTFLWIGERRSPEAALGGRTSSLRACTFVSQNQKNLFTAVLTQTGFKHFI